jgi:predicted metal-dependent hydrolase
VGLYFLKAQALLKKYLTKIMQIRKIQFQLLKEIEPLWLANNSFKTQFFNTLSMFFPFGEGYFIETFRDITRKNLVRDLALSEKIRIFTAQEAMHSHAHQEFNDYLHDQGLPFTLLGWFEVRSSIFNKIHSHTTKLAVTMAYEHITAIFSYLALRDNLLGDVCDQNLKRMWLWHASEEIEHRSIAFELYQHIGGGYWRRQYGMLFAILNICIDTSAQVILNLYRSGLLFKLKTWREAYGFMFGRDRFIPLSARKLYPFIKPQWYPPELGVNLAEQWLKENSDYFRVLGK